MQQLRTRHDARLNSENAPAYRVIPPQLLAPLGLTDDEILARARDILTHRLHRSTYECGSPQQVRDYLVVRYAELQHEVFGAVWLDHQHRVLADEVLFIGTINQTSVYPREVVKAALRHNAAAVVIFHNHPSGVGDPSTADLRLTESLKTTLALIDVRIIDHFIVAGTAAPVSFAERGLI